MELSSPTLCDVLGARKAIDKVAIQTPVVRSSLRTASDTPLWLKLETVQATGSFKLRGAANAIAHLSLADRELGVVCCSTGNHGRALAYAAQQMGVKATVCLSRLAPKVKLEAVKALGARVIVGGESQDEAQCEVDRLVESEGLSEIPPFDHPAVIAGQGTIALELLQEKPELETLLVPLSGGGLISGIATAAKAIKPTIRIVGISMDRGAAMAASVEAGHPVDVREVVSLADSLGGGIGLQNRHTFDICRNLVDEIVLLSEEEIYRGMRAMFFDDRLVAEGAAAVGHAAVVCGKVDLNGPAASIVSGGNVDPKQFADVVAGKPLKLGDLTVRVFDYE